MRNKLHIYVLCKKLEMVVRSFFGVWSFVFFPLCLSRLSQSHILLFSHNPPSTYLCRWPLHFDERGLKKAREWMKIREILCIFNKCLVFFFKSDMEVRYREGLNMKQRYFEKKKYKSGSMLTPLFFLKKRGGGKQKGKPRAIMLQLLKMDSLVVVQNVKCKSKWIGYVTQPLRGVRRVHWSVVSPTSV